MRPKIAALILVALYLAVGYIESASALQSGPPVEREIEWMYAAQAVAFSVLGRALPNPAAVILVRDPWEPLPWLGNKNWRDYFGKKHCTEPRFTVPLGCVGGSFVGRQYVMILHLPPSFISVYNATLGLSPGDDWYREPCFYDLDRLVSYYIHEGLHAVGYIEGKAMANTQKLIQNAFDAIYATALAADDLRYCDPGGSIFADGFED